MPPHTPPTYQDLIRRLGKRQRAVLDQFGCGNRFGHPPKIVLALADKGLLEEEVVEQRDRFGPYEVRSWYMPVYVNYHWSKVMASEPDDEDDET